jgi:WD40 repeat protein
VPGISNNPVVTLRLSPDSAWVAAQFQDGHSELHAVKGTRPAQKWPGRLSPKSLCSFSAAADRFAIAEPGRPIGHNVEVWFLPEVKLRATVATPVPPTALAFDHPGHLLAIAADDLTVWNVATTNRLWSAPLENNASATAWSPDGRWIAVALDVRLKQDKTKAPEDDMNPVWLYNAATGQRISLFSETRGRVEHLIFHPDGQSLALADWGGELIWGSLQGHGFRLRTEAAQRALDFSADGKRIAYSPSRDELAMLELAQPQVLREWTPLSEPVRNTYAIAVSSDGRWVATGTDTKIQLWDAENRREIASHKLPADHWWMTAMFGPDDASLYYGAFSFGVHRVQLVRGEAGQLRFGADEMISKGNDFLPLGFAADGHSLIVSQNRRTAKNDRIPHTVWYWPQANSADARKLVQDYPLVGFRAISGPWAVSADLISPDATIWNIDTGQRVRMLGINLPVSCEIAPNGRWLITRTRDELVVWEVGTWKPLSRCPVAAEEQASSWVVASPDSRLLINRTGRGELILRHLPSAEKLLTLPAPRSGQVFDFRFHPSANRLFVLLKNGRLFEWHFGPLREQLARLNLDW